MLFYIVVFISWRFLLTPDQYAKEFGNREVVDELPSVCNDVHQVLAVLVVDSHAARDDLGRLIFTTGLSCGGGVGFILILL